MTREEKKRFPLLEKRGGVASAEALRVTLARKDKACFLCKKRDTRMNRMSR